jgi:hypothetical protein
MVASGGRHQASLVLVLVLELSWTALVSAASSMERAMYHDVRPVNTTDSLRIIDQLPLR